MLRLPNPGHARFPHPIPIECSSLLSGLLCHTHPASMLYGTEAGGCLSVSRTGPNGSFNPVFNASAGTCKIENYPLLRIEVTQPGTKENPTLYLSAVFPQSSAAAPVIWLRLYRLQTQITFCRPSRRRTAQRILTGVCSGGSGFCP
jgi:hypothetical protein